MTSCQLYKLFGCEGLKITFPSLILCASVTFLFDGKIKFNCKSRVAFKMMTSNLSSPQRYQTSVPDNSILSTFNQPQQQKQRNQIWGTTIFIDEASRKCKLFIRQFTTSHIAQDENTPHIKLYHHQLEAAVVSGSTVLDIDLHHIDVYNSDLYQWCITYPSELIPIFDQQITQIAVDEFNHHQHRPFKCRLFNPPSHPLRDIPPSSIEHLIQIQGFIVRVGELIPDLYKAIFKCESCHASVDQIVQKTHLIQPSNCPNCNDSQILLSHTLSEFTGKQLIRLQESPESIPAGQTPVSILCAVYDDINTMQPGDRVVVSGILRNTANRLNSKRRQYTRTTKCIIEVVHCQSDQSKIQQQHTLTEAMLNQVKQLGKRQDIYSLLVKSLAPGIFDLDDAKKGVLLQLMGGVEQPIVKTRGNIHILLVGDPGVSKSQLLQQIHQIAPRSIYTSGKGSSAVGLTASITRDPDTNAFVLMSGALVMSDGGICCLDEFDKASHTSQAILHEVMEQQTVSIAKAGIVTSLRARTSILAAANPVQSRFDLNKSIVENINLSPSLLSRFDLVYVLLDHSTEKTDALLARQIASLCTHTQIENESVLSRELVTAYISVASQLEPRFSEEASQYCIQQFMEMRNLQRQYKSQHVTATTRQLMSMMRIAEAHAKVHMRDLVLVEDVEESCRLIKVALQQSATDPKTGRINMDLLLVGHSEGMSSVEKEMMDALEGLKSCGVGDLMHKMEGNRRDLMAVLEGLDKKGYIYWDKSLQIVRVLE